MASTRLDILKNMVAQNPGDAFSRYGLALEYRNTGDLESSKREFEVLASADPDYVPAYYQHGRTLETMGLLEEARLTYRAGIDAATRKGDSHARSELEAALDLLGDA